MIFSQRDPRWASTPLGASKTSTLGTSGCYVTALCQALYNWGHTWLDPGLLNAVIMVRNAYINGCLLDEKVLPTIFPGCAELVGAWDYEKSPADLSRLARDEDEEIILKLDWDYDKTNGIKGHFVRYAGVDPLWKDIILIDDPWYGDTAPITQRYGPDPRQAIAKIIKYRMTRIIKAKPIEVRMTTETDDSTYRAFLDADAGLSYVELRKPLEDAGCHVFYNAETGKVLVTPLAKILARQIHKLTEGY